MKRLLLAILILSVLSCTQKDYAAFEKETLFTLNYSAMDDGIYPRAYNRIAMHDGFLYITDSLLGKVMKFNSYGDLLLVADGGDFKKDLASPGKIAVDDSQNFFVADAQEDCRCGWSADLKCSLTDVVKCFDRSGRLFAELGQDGPGSEPFPPISKLETRSDMSLAVHALSPAGQIVYLFDKNLNPMTKTVIDAVIVPCEEAEDRIVSVDSASCSKTEDKLFIKVDHYSGNNDDAEYSKSSICCYDLHLKSVTKSVDIPESDMPYQLLGVNGCDRIFLTAPSYEGGYKLLIVDFDEGDKTEIQLEFDPCDVLQSDMTLSNQGTIAALLTYEEGASAVWWRSDKIGNKTVKEEN